MTYARPCNLPSCARPTPTGPPRRHLRYAVPLLALEAGLVLSWSSGFIGARYSIDYAPAFVVVFWRCVLVMMLLFPWVAAELRTTPVKVLLRHAGIGLLALAGYLAGVVKGIELGVPAGLAALIADLLPIGTAVLAAVLLKQRMTRRLSAGLAIGLAGVVLVTYDALSLGAASLWSYALPLAGMLSLALATLWQKRSQSSASMGLLTNLWVQCTVSAAAFAALAATEGSLMPVRGWGFGVSVLWTAILSTLGGYGLYWLCLKRSSPTRVASVLYLSPAVTLLGSWAMFDDPLSWLMLAGTVVSGVGIWMVVRAEATSPARSHP